MTFDLQFTFESNGNNNDDRFDCVSIDSRKQSNMKWQDNTGTLCVSVVLYVALYVNMNRFFTGLMRLPCNMEDYRSTSSCIGETWRRLQRACTCISLCKGENG